MSLRELIENTEKGIYLTAAELIKLDPEQALAYMKRVPNDVLYRILSDPRICDWLDKTVAAWEKVASKPSHLARTFSHVCAGCGGVTDAVICPACRTEFKRTEE